MIFDKYVISLTDMKKQKIYNPDHSKLRHDQMTMVEILDYFAEICRQNDITWWMSSGSLLGTARHEGFIPWDDDIDVVMLKKDYLRLEKILSSLDDDKYFFQSVRTDIEYINIFGKLRLREGYIDAKDRRKDYYKCKGLGIDIFAIEKTGYVAAFLAKFLYHSIQYPTSYIKVKWIRRPLIRFVEFLHFYLLFPILKIVGLVNPKGEYRYILGTGWPKHSFLMKDTFPLTTGMFEGRRVPVPKDTDAYLTRVFGDWKAIPSEEEIRKAIHCMEYRKEIFGD